MPKKTLRRRTKHRGGYYGASGAIAPGAMAYTAGSEMGAYTADQINAGAQVGRGRRRKSRGRKSKKTRKHRGGGKYGGVSASYGGDGVRGMANFTGINTRAPPLNGPAALGAFNNAGAQPGSGHASFNILPK
jgi:hypothetical protein